ncbi:hypothetical protein TYRP_022009 [Tyrophagus putrescentiae]|nr:hypothetical protein TYRP_022009 [Tyrophagus putrescentiae]
MFITASSAFRSTNDATMSKVVECNHLEVRVNTRQVKSTHILMRRQADRQPKSPNSGQHGKWLTHLGNVLVIVDNVKCQCAQQAECC